MDRIIMYNIYYDITLLQMLKLCRCQGIIDRGVRVFAIYHKPMKTTIIQAKILILITEAKQLFFK